MIIAAVMTCVKIMAPQRTIATFAYATVHQTRDAGQVSSAGCKNASSQRPPKAKNTTRIQSGVLYLLRGLKGFLLKARDAVSMPNAKIRKMTMKKAARLLVKVLKTELWCCLPGQISSAVRRQPVVVKRPTVPACTARNMKP